jgi:hypothetical protein
MSEWQFALFVVGIGCAVLAVFALVAIGMALDKIARTLDHMLHELRTRGKMGA